MPFTGVVLAGGRSRRMGTDKAFVTVADPAGTGDPRPLATVARDALRDAGGTPVVAVGGDAERLAGLGLDTWPDEHPDEGPLGGLLTALTHAPLDLVVVLTCDMPAIDAASVRGLVQALSAAPEADAAVPVVDGVAQVLTAAYRRRARGPLAAAFDRGERSVKRALVDLEVVPVEHLDPRRLVDLDRPEDLENYALADPSDQHQEPDP